MYKNRKSWFVQARDRAGTKREPEIQKEILTAMQKTTRFANLLQQGST
jgi:hypothetical protein